MAAALKHETLWPRIRQLDAEGKSTSDIAKALGCGWTKNMVIRQRRSMGLPARSNPCGSGHNLRTWSEEETAELLRQRQTATAWGSISVPNRSLAACQDHYRTLVAQSKAPPAPAMPPPKPPVKKARSAPKAKRIARRREAVSPPILRDFKPERGNAVIPCCHQLGGWRDLVFCDAKSLPGRGYCAEHVP